MSARWNVSLWQFSVSHFSKWLLWYLDLPFTNVQLLSRMDLELARIRTQHFGCYVECPQCVYCNTEMEYTFLRTVWKAIESIVPGKIVRMPCEQNIWTASTWLRPSRFRVDRQPRVKTSPVLIDISNRDYQTQPDRSQVSIIVLKQLEGSYMSKRAVDVEGKYPMDE